MSKFKNSAGGFGDDFVWSQVEMYRHNYRKHGDPRDLIKILEVIEPFLEKDISQAIIKYIEEQPMPKLGAKRAFENEAIVKLFELHSKTHPEKHLKKYAMNWLLNLVEIVVKTFEKFLKNMPYYHSKLKGKSRMEKLTP